MLAWLASFAFGQDIDFSSVVKDSLFRDQFRGVIYVQRGETVLLEHTAGVDVSGRALDKNSYFQLGDLSKPFVGAAIADLIAQGRVKKDDPVSDHMRQLTGTALRKDDVPCTIEYLLSHQCGIPIRLPGSDSIEQDERFYDSINRLRLRSVPGEEQNYSHAGYRLAGDLLSSLVKEDYTVYMKERVWNGHDFAIPLSDSQKRRMAKAQFKLPLAWLGTARWLNIPVDSHRVLGAGQNMVGSADGLLSWFSSVSENQSLFQELRTERGNGYGLGLIIDEKSYGTMLWHNGSLPMSHSVFAGIIPETKTIAVVLSSRPDGVYSTTHIGKALLTLAHGSEYRSDLFDKSAVGNFQASLPGLITLSFAFVPLLVMLFGLRQQPSPRFFWAFSMQFFAFASLFVRQSVPMSEVVLGEVLTVYAFLALVLFLGLKARRHEPLLYPRLTINNSMFTIIFGVLMFLWIQRAPNPTLLLIPLFMTGIILPICARIWPERTEE